jgi:hypothetical protein
MQTKTTHGHSAATRMRLNVRGTDEWCLTAVLLSSDAQPDEAIEDYRLVLRPGRRTALTFPLFPPPQKKRSRPSDSSPDTLMP